MDSYNNRAGGIAIADEGGGSGSSFFLILIPFIELLNCDD